jgi:hypothetical protein
MERLIIYISITLLLTNNLIGQDRSIIGKVISEDLESISTIRIYDMDTSLIGETDLEGLFTISISQETEILLLHGIGLEWTTVQLINNCDNIEVVMMYHVIYDFTNSRKIERLRKRRCKEIPEIYSSAIEKGIFKNEEKCYNQKFYQFYN